MNTAIVEAQQLPLASYDAAVVRQFGTDVILKGDVSALSRSQRAEYLKYLCSRYRLDPLTLPFDIIEQSGKAAVYANKSCSTQLAERQAVSCEVVREEQTADIYVVYVRASTPDGRFTDDCGATTIKGKTGDALCNARMKALTKAKRRATLSHCGLGVMDESEIETTRGGNDRPASPLTERLNRTAAGKKPDAENGTPAPDPGTPPPHSEPEDAEFEDVPPPAEPLPQFDLNDDVGWKSAIEATGCDNPTLKRLCLAWRVTRAREVAGPDRPLFLEELRKAAGR